MNAEDMRKITQESTGCSREEHKRKAYIYIDKKLKEVAESGLARAVFTFDGGYVDYDAKKWIARNVSGITESDIKEHYRGLGFRFEREYGVEYICW